QPRREQSSANAPRSHPRLRRAATTLARATRAHPLARPADARTLRRSSSDTQPPRRTSANSMAPDRARPLADRSPRAADNFDYHRTRHYHGRELLMRASAVRTEPHCHDVLVIDDYDETREA